MEHKRRKTAHFSYILFFIAALQFLIYFICLSGASTQVFLLREAYNLRQVTVEDIQRVNRPFDRENHLAYGEFNDCDYLRLVLSNLYGYYSTDPVRYLSRQFASLLGPNLTNSALKRSLSLARSRNLVSSSLAQSLLLLTSYSSATPGESLSVGDDQTSFSA